MQVEGLNDGSEIVMLDDKDFKLLVSQDGATQEAKIRAIHQMRTSRPRADNGANGNVEPGEMRLL